VLITAGGLVTSTDSGLAVPDWPLSYGQLFPPMVGGILYEHGHRMIATAVGLLTIVLAWALARWESRAWVRRLGFVALGAVVTQGLLGGLTVLLLLPTPISVAHACLAQAFLLTVVTIALVTRPSWNRLATDGAENELARATARRVRTPALFATAAVYCQLILGAFTRHTGAGLAIPDFPLALGRIVPPLTDPLVAIQFAHRAGALVVTSLIVFTCARALGRHAAASPLRGPAIALLALTGLQIGLGAAAVWTRLAVLPATAHVTTGAALLATSLVLTLRAHRLAPPAPLAEPLLAPLRPVMP
jgi:cytochrome c oxidase assembly protein subunit 15